VYAARFGCFDLSPAGAAIPRNYARGPNAINLVLRMSRTWSFGGEGRSGLPEQENGSHGGSPLPMAASGSSGRKYNITLSANTLNAFNRSNYAPPEGVLTSPYFGRSRSLGGIVVMSHGGASSAYNRKIDLQVRFTF
jgi:hypothetical protein